MTVYPSLHVALFQVAAVIARAELPEPLDVEAKVRDGEVLLSLTLADPDDLHRWTRKCGGGAAQTIRETAFDIDGVPHTVTTAYGAFAGSRIHLTTLAPAEGGTTTPTGGTP